MGSPDDRPIISTLIPTYRRPRLLERAVRSVLSQTYSGVRACVFDNASGDDTGPAMKRLAAEDSRVVYWCHPSNMGAGPNFNYAIGEVTTPFFSFLSDDDLLIPTFYETAMNEFSRHPEAGFVALDVLNLSSWGDLSLSPALQRHPEGLYEPMQGLFAMLDPFPTTWTGIVYRTEVLQSIGRLNLDVGAASDIDFTLRAAARFPFAVRHIPGAIFTNNSIALDRMVRGIPEGFWPGWKVMVDQLCSDLPFSKDAAAMLRSRLMEILSSILAITSVAGSVRGDFSEASEGATLLKRELDKPVLGDALKALAILCRRFPLVHASVAALFNARVKVRALWRKWRNSYSRYYPLLDTSSAP